MIALKARAKINLALGVSAPMPASHSRPGFHEIASWMVALELCDDLQVSRAAAGPGSMMVRWAPDAPRPTPIDWPTESDLVYRAWKLLEATSGRSLPASIVLEKRVPVGGGLGGGSADAAAALLAITALFNLPFTIDQLRQLSTQLGSDIAFFLDDDDLTASPRPALVTGFGDQLERTSRIESEVLLIVPSFGCPTRPVYQAFDAHLGTTDKGTGLDAVRALIGQGVPLSQRELFNDLAHAAAAVAWPLEPIRQQIARTINRPVHVTGSGSCMFVLPAETPDQSLRSSWVRSVNQAGACAVWTRFAARAV